MDYIVRATAMDAQIRAFFATTKDLTEIARAAHNTSPIATAALGRLMTAGAMMGSMLKSDGDLLTLRMKGTGPMKGITVTADAKSRVKGYVDIPDVVLKANALGKLDVGGAIGNGILTVIQDMGLKEPYVGQCELQTGEIAEDLTYYFATSEQVPSSVGLGVLMNKDNTVRCAGGFIIQLMPFVQEEVIKKLESNLANVKSVTAMLDEGNTPEQMMEILLKDLNPEVTDRIEPAFTCNCSKNRISKALLSIGEKDLKDMIEDGEPIEVKCHFCNQAYSFEIEELKELLKKGKRK